MPVALAAPPAPVTTPGAALLARIAAEVHLTAAGPVVAGRPVPLPGRRGGTPAVHAALTDALLHRYHLGGAADRPSDRPAWSDPAVVRRVAELLGHRCCWEDGWRVAGSGAGGWLVEREGLVLPVGDDEVRFTTSGVRVRFPADRAQSSGGWLVVAGTTGPAPRAGRLAECALHLLPGPAPAVFAALVGRLDERGVAFTARLLVDPSVRGRPDAAVVTAARGDLPAVQRAALELHRRDRAAFGGAVPGFTHAVAPGVAVSDSPDPGPGFGRHRCGLVAAGLLAAGPGAGCDERLAAVRAAFTGAGIDPDRPHLGPAGADPAPGEVRS